MKARIHGFFFEMRTVHGPRGVSFHHLKNALVPPLPSNIHQLGTGECALAFRLLVNHWGKTGSSNPRDKLRQNAPSRVCSPKGEGPLAKVIN